MIRRVLVALDDSPRAPGVVAAAVDICERFGARLVPFRAVQIPPDFPPAARNVLGDPLPAHLHEVAVTQLRQLLQGVAADCDAPVIGHGQPWRAILRAAEEQDVDLIVLGSHGYHGLDRVLGTTAGMVANLARRSTLVIHDRAEDRRTSSSDDTQT